MGPHKKDPMKWMAVKVFFQFEASTLAADLIADCFYSLGIKGVVIDDPVADLDEDWGPMPARNAVTGYLPVDDQLKNTLAQFRSALDKLAGTTGIRSRGKLSWSR